MQYKLLGQATKAAFLGSKPLMFRVLLTVVAMLLSCFDDLFVLPGLDWSGADYEYREQLSDSLSIFVFWLEPFVYAFVIVEIFALVVPCFRRRRHGDGKFRSNLNVSALILGFVLAFVQGIGVATYLESLNGLDGIGALVPEPGIWFRVKSSALFAFGSSMLVAVAALVSKKGVGNGFAVLIFAKILKEFFERVSEHVVAYGQYSGAQWEVLIGPLAALGTIVVCSFAIDRLGKFFVNGKGMPVLVPTSGVYPLYFLSYAMASVGFIMMFSGEITWLQGAQETIGTQPLLRFFIGLFGIVILCPIYSLFFYWGHKEKFKKSERKAEWRKVNIVSVLFLCCFWVLIFVLPFVIESVGVFFQDAVYMLLAAALSLDLFKEIQARGAISDGEDLVPLESHQDVVSVIERANVIGEKQQVFIQGLHFRSMTYFFAPYVPMRIIGKKVG